MFRDAGVDTTKNTGNAHRFFTITYHQILIMEFPLHPVQQRLRCAFFRSLRTPFFGNTARGGHHVGHHLFKITRVTPVKTEKLPERSAMLGPGDKAGVQRPIEIRAFGEASGLHRVDRIQRSARPDRQARLPQPARKMGDVARELGVFWKGKVGKLYHRRAPGRCLDAVFRDKKSRGMRVMPGPVRL